MKLYAERPGRRLRQLLADLLAALWLAAWVGVGRVLYRLLAMLAEPGRIMERAGERFAEAMARTGGRLEEVPLVGGGLADAFDAAAGAGRTLAEAGAAQQETVVALALWLAVAVAAVPVLSVLLLYLPWRIRWVREASVADRLRLDEHTAYLLALRAVTNRPLRRLHRVVDDPGAAFARGDYEALARLELETLGLEATGRAAEGDRPR